MSAAKKYVIDKRDEILHLNKLKEFYNELKQNQIVGEIVWHHNQPGLTPENQEAARVISQIETHLLENNKRFSRFASDFIHGQISYDIFRDDIKESQYALGGTDWKVIKIYNEPSEDTLKNKKGEKYSAAIYMNESKRQMILAHRGINAELTSYFKIEGDLNKNVEEILLGDVVPQLAICFEITKDANQLATEKECFLSFTGYSNGAWLAEHSNYYSGRYFKNQNTKAVLFESPGILRIQNELASHKARKQDLADLNVINYLTEPSFSNTLDKHVGKSYRLFIGSKKDEEDMANSLLDKLKLIPDNGEMIYKKIQNSKYFINTLLTIFDHRRLRKILETFDAETGMPKYSEEITHWPSFKLSLDKKYKDNLKNLLKHPNDKLVDLIPIPELAKNKTNNIIHETLNFTTEILLEKTVPGVHLILNIIFEICKGNIDLSQFENTLFYSRLNGSKTVVSEEHKDKKNHLTFKIESEFIIKIKNSYSTQEKNDKVQIVEFSSSENIDWCLEKLKGTTLEPKVFSKIVFKSLHDLKSCYDIENNLEDKDGNKLKSIKVKSSDTKLSIEMVRERMIKLLDINPNLRDLLKFKKKSNNLFNISHDLNERIPIIGRDEIISKIKHKFCETKTPTIILSAFGGLGKSCIANEYGHIVKDKDNEYTVRWILADKKDNFESSIRQLARLFLIPKIEIQSQHEILVNLISKINNYNGKFLFILDSVDKYDIIKDFVVKTSELPENQVKLLITTRKKNLIDDLDKDCVIEIESFDQEDANSYIDKFLKSKNINKSQRSKLIELVKFDDKILPLKLKLTVKYINKNLIKSDLNKVLDDIKEDSKVSKQVQDYLFKKIPSRHLKVMAYCSFFDPNFISLKILNKLFKDVKESLENLSNDGLIEMNLEKRCFKIHRLVQHEMKAYIHNNSSEFENLGEILNNIVQILNECATEIDNNSMSSIEKCISIEQEYIQVKAILHFIEKKSLADNDDLGLDTIKYLKLKDKLANFYMRFENKNDKALESYIKINEIRSRKYKDDHPDVANSLNNQGVCYSKLGDEEKCLEFKLKAYEIRSKLYKEDSPDISHSLNSLGVSYSKLGDNQKALEYYLKAYEMRSRLYKGNHVDLAESLKSLGVIYGRLCDDHKALEFKLKTYEMRCSLYKGEDHPDVAESLNSLGVTYGHLGDDKKAMEYFLKAYEMRTRLYKDDHPEIVESLSSIGVSFCRLGNNKKSLEYELKAFEMRSNLYKEENPNLANSLSNLGYCFTRLEDDHKALEYFLKAYDMRLKLYKNEHPDIADSLNSLGICYERLGDDQKALEYKLKAYDLRIKLYKDDHPDIAEILNGLAVSYSRLGNNKKALEYDLKAYEMRMKLFNSDHPDIAESLNCLGVSYARSGEDKKALECFEKSYDMRTRLYKTDHPDIAESLFSLATCYSGLNNLKKALECGLQAYEMRTRLFKEDHHDIIESLHSLAAIYEKTGDNKKSQEFNTLANEMEMRLKS